jgi:NADH-quinone oxidoreductase subunit L
MAIALIVLAIGSALAGYASLGGRFERFLEPSFGPQTIEGAGAGGLETTLMAVSSAVAFAGIGIAVFFFLKNRRAADAAAERFRVLHRVLLNKYYVDEIYDATIVQPMHIVSEEGLWKRADARLIDGAVNGAGDTIRGMSEVLRRLQTGSVRTYAASLFAGVVLILGYYLWR